MTAFPEAGLVVAAGGGSRRFGERNKLLEPLGGQPVFLHCLRRLACVVPPQRTVLVVPAAEQDVFAAALREAGCSVPLVAGGVSRAESL